MMYDIDEHLDTSWCPVCDRMILPKRYQVPVDPPAPVPQPSQPAPSSSTTAIRQSQTTRGKHGTIKARNGAVAGGGLLHGTGRVRPGFQRTQSSKTKPVPPPVQEPPAPMRMRTVIDQAQTPLYCSEQCRQADLAMSWFAAPPPARIALEEEIVATDARSAARLDAHPAHLNPARASPPPPSPTLPPVPPNSWRAPGLGPKDLGMALASLDLSRVISEQEEDQSDDSSASGTSPSPSDAKPKAVLAHIFDEPAPPPLPPMKPHPHGNKAPVRPPPLADDEETKPERAGFFTAARRISSFFRSGQATDESARARKEERSAREKEEDNLIARQEGMGLKESEDAKKKRERERRRLDREESEMAKLRQPEHYQEMLYGEALPTPGSQLTPSIPGISTHRRRSDFGGPPPPDRVAAQGAPSRTQSALELYSKYPSNPQSFAAAFRTKSSVSIATSYTPAFGTTTLGTSPTSSVHSSTTSRTAQTSATAPVRVHSRRNVAEGLEGKLLLPEVLLRPRTASTTYGGIQRTQSENNVASRPHRGGRRPSSTLGAVREEEGGVWHRPEDERSETSRSSETSSSTDTKSRSRKTDKGKGKQRASKARSTVSETRSTTSAPPLAVKTYDGPLYNIVPNIPIRQLRYEEVFVPDELDDETFVSSSAPATSSTGSAVNIRPGEYLAVSELHMKDVETNRRALREVSRRRGMHQGREGWWVEKEWEVTCIPERKRLFNLDSESSSQ